MEVYTIEFEGITVTSAGGDNDLFEVVPADDRPIKIFGIFLGVSSELGDAAEEILRIRVIRGHTTSSNGTAVTPQNVNPRGVAAGFTAERVGTTIAAAGSPINLHSDMFNVRSPMGLWLPEKAAWGCDQAQSRIVVRLMAAVTDDVTMSGTLYVAEG